MRWKIAILVSALVAVPAAAEEILHLKSGATMPIATHEVRGQMIHVDMGGNAFMAFPLSMVDWIEKAGANVLLQPSFHANNVMAPGPPDPTRSYPARGIPNRSNTGQLLKQRQQTPNPHVAVDSKMGIAVYRPTPHGSRAKRSLAFWGNRALLEQQSGGPLGTTRVGDRFVISREAQLHQSPAIGVQQRVRGRPPAKPPTPPTPPPASDPSQGSSGGSSDGE